MKRRPPFKRSCSSVLFGFAVALALFDGQMPVASIASPLPNPAVEARAARELLAVESKIAKPSSGRNSDWLLTSIATSLAQLGRVEAALKVVDEIREKDAIAVNGAPQTRAEILRLLMRRRCVFGKLDEAKALIPQIHNSTARADAWLTLARAYLRRGEMALATRALYSASPLVKQNIQATAYTAYLLSKSGDWDAAKRLFARAEKQLAPIKPLNMSRSKDDWTFNLRAQSERGALASYLFKTGLIDEAIRIKESAREGQNKDRFLPVYSSEQLARVNRFDDALRVAREERGYNGVASRVYLALIIDKRKQDRPRALQILVEAESEYRRLALESDEGKRSLDAGLKGFTMQVMIAVSISAVARELGQETQAQQWLTEGVKNLEPETEAIVQIYRAIFPLGMSEQESWVIPLGQLKQIDIEVQAQMPNLRDSRAAHDLCRILTQAYIKSGQPEAVRPYLVGLERATLAEKPTKNNINFYHRLIKLARDWREIGDEARAQSLLMKVDEIALPAGMTKYEIAREMIYNGFIEEGHTRLAKLPREHSYGVDFYRIAVWEAKYQPNIFPSRISQITHLETRIEELANFTNGLTASIYNTPQERELVLAVKGSRSSYGYGSPF